MLSTPRSAPALVSLVFVSLLAFPATATALPLAGLRSLIVGGGPSGLLLAHRLLDAGGSVSLLEGRPDPRTPDYLEGRAYALGLGLRGRTAIRTADEALWQAVASSGFPADRFTLHLGPQLKVDLRTPGDSNAEPSILIYQSDLCAALLDEMLQRHGGSRLTTAFGARVTACDPLTGSVTYLDAAGEECTASADMVAGCDGVNSVVRRGIGAAAPAFRAETTPLPGNLKVHSACTLHARFSHASRTLHARCMHAASTLHARCIYAVCAPIQGREARCDADRAQR